MGYIINGINNGIYNGNILENMYIRPLKHNEFTIKKGQLTAKTWWYSCGIMVVFDGDKAS